ncbi:hypothetical protein GCM10011315_10590 [Roseovarius pacificus]|nr:hypothetical protein GCM10011315_10590 [Roseovarius pacificus]
MRRTFHSLKQQPAITGNTTYAGSSPNHPTPIKWRIVTPCYRSRPPRRAPGHGNRPPETRKAETPDPPPKTAHRSGGPRRPVAMCGANPL